MNESSRTTTPVDISSSAAFDAGSVLIADHPSESDATLVPLRDCTPWCREGDGHAGVHPADRYCTSDGLSVLRSLGEPEEYDKGEWRLPWVGVNLRREPNDDRAQVVVLDEARSSEVVLTPDEARALITALGKALDQLGVVQ